MRLNMSGVSRRDALKMTATGLTVGAGVLLAEPGLAAEGKTVGRPEDRWQGHKLADPKELEKATKPVRVRMGVQPPGGKAAVADAELMKEVEDALRPMGTPPVVLDDWGSPRPDLNGLRVKFPNRPEIYLIDRGYRRWVPNPMTYNNLFRDWNGIVVDIDINEIPLAVQISSGAILVRADGTAPVYLVDQGTKRWITSPAIMDKYYFAWGRVYVLPPASVYPIPVGPSIDS